jgi:hypothetical protein
VSKRLAAIVGLGMLALALPLPRAQAQEAGPKQSFEVTSTERVAFAPGGAIRIDNSYGYLTVEGWDSPEVEITVMKSTDRFYQPSRRPQAEKRFDDVRVVAVRKSANELTITTTLAVRKNLFTSVLPSGQTVFTPPLVPKGKRGVTVDCKVLVPRDSRLVIHQDNGYVWVSDVTGDLDVRSHTGDMTVMLPDPGSYSIDAATRFGSVSSDLVGKAHREILVGTNFSYAGKAPSRRVYLRMGRGSITIKSGPPSGPFEKD